MIRRALLALLGALALVATLASPASAAPGDYPEVQNWGGSTSDVRVFSEPGCTGEYELLSPGESNRDGAQAFPLVQVPWPKSYRFAGVTDVLVYETGAGGTPVSYSFTLHRSEGVWCLTTAINRVYEVQT